MRVIFDTNFWSYLAFSDYATTFVFFEKELNLEVILPPSILLEVQKTKNRETRIEIIKVMNKGHRKKSRTEVDLESEELINEIRRLRPECRNKMTNTKRIIKLRKYWTRDIWKNAIDDTDYLHDRILRTDKKQIDMFIKEEEENKQIFQKVKWDINNTRPSGIKAQFHQNDTYASKFADINKEYEPWRIVNLYYYKKGLENVSLPQGHDDRTLADWCEPWINIGAFLADKKRYWDFWLEEVNIGFMQRNWLRWAIRTFQSFRKISSGNPYDDQHSAYLLDAEIFFTSDRRYYDCLKAIYSNGIIDMAKPVLIEADMHRAIEQIKQECK